MPRAGLRGQPWPGQLVSTCSVVCRRIWRSNYDALQLLSDRSIFSDQVTPCSWTPPCNQTWQWAERTAGPSVYRTPWTRSSWQSPHSLTLCRTSKSKCRAHSWSPWECPSEPSTTARIILGLSPTETTAASRQCMPEIRRPTSRTCHHSLHGQS